MKRLTLSTFKERAYAKHGSKFDYSNVQLSGVDTKVFITCPIHGEFLQTPYKHLNSKYGCKACGIAAAASTKTHTTADFIAAAKAIHGDKYIYDKTIYSNAKNKLVITCPTHGDFTQLASGHLSGYGCKKCTSYGKGRVDMSAPCTLYYFNIVGTTIFKVGITTRSIDERYRTSFDKSQINLIFSKVYSTGQEAYNEEQRLLAEFSDSKYVGAPLLLSGNTELFIRDIFQGNYSDYQPNYKDS